MLLVFAVAVTLMSLACARLRGAAIAWFILAAMYMGLVLLAYAGAMFIPLAAMQRDLSNSV